jgi:hypothetical protein
MRLSRFVGEPPSISQDLIPVRGLLESAQEP